MDDKKLSELDEASGFFNGDYYYVVSSGKSYRISAAVMKAAISSDAEAGAKAYTDSVIAGISGGAAVYADTTAGLAATSEGDFFSVPSDAGSELLTLYEHEAGGVARELGSSPSSQISKDTAADVADIKKTINEGGEAFFTLENAAGEVIARVREDQFLQIGGIDAGTIDTDSIESLLVKSDVAEVGEIETGQITVPDDADGPIIEMTNAAGEVMWRINRDGSQEGSFPGGGSAPVELNEAQLSQIETSLSVKKESKLRQGVITDKNAWSQHYLLLTASQSTAPGFSGSDTVFWPWIVKTDTIDEPLGAYYMFYSTDHDDGVGGIFMAYSDDLTGPWQTYGVVYRDSSGSGQTESPSVIYDAHDEVWRLYYHNQGGLYGDGDSLNPPGDQTTLCATSTNLINWTKDPYFALSLESKDPGSGHTGYFRPGYTPFGLMGQSLYGGTSTGYRCNYMHTGGTLGGFLDGNGDPANNWFRYQVYPRNTIDNDNITRKKALIVDSFELNGTRWAVGRQRVENANNPGPTADRPGNITIAPVNNSLTISQPGAHQIIWEPEETWEQGSNVKPINTYVEDGKVYVFYVVDDPQELDHKRGTFIGMMYYDAAL